jgi:hypothetical protein
MAMRTFTLLPAMALFVPGVPAQQNETKPVTAHVNTSSQRGPQTEVVGVPTLDTSPEMQRGVSRKGKHGRRLWLGDVMVGRGIARVSNGLVRQFKPPRVHDNEGTGQMEGW